MFVSSFGDALRLHTIPLGNYTVKKASRLRTVLSLLQQTLGDCIRYQASACWLLNGEPVVYMPRTGGLLIRTDYGIIIPITKDFRTNESTVVFSTLKRMEKLFVFYYPVTVVNINFHKENLLINPAFYLFGNTEKSIQEDYKVIVFDITPIYFLPFFNRFPGTKKNL